jgi:hypothetical protein
MFIVVVLSVFRLVLWWLLVAPSSAFAFSFCCHCQITSNTVLLSIHTLISPIDMSFVCKTIALQSIAIVLHFINNDPSLTPSHAHTHTTRRCIGFFFANFCGRSNNQKPTPPTIVPPSHYPFAINKNKKWLILPPKSTCPVCFTLAT